MGAGDAVDASIHTLKRAIEQQIVKWYATNSDSQIVLAVLGELTAETALVLLGKNHAVSYLHHLCEQVVCREYPESGRELERVRNALKRGSKH